MEPARTGCCPVEFDGSDGAPVVERKVVGTDRAAKDPEVCKSTDGTLTMEPPDAVLERRGRPERIAQGNGSD